MIESFGIWTQPFGVETDMLPDYTNILLIGSFQSTQAVGLEPTYLGFPSWFNRPRLTSIWATLENYGTEGIRTLKPRTVTGWCSTSWTTIPKWPDVDLNHILSSNVIPLCTLQRKLTKITPFPNIIWEQDVYHFITRPNGDSSFTY